jgi:squalene-associated FAD-dependent desaturase
MSRPASDGRCVSTTAACRSGFSIPPGACPAPARSTTWRWRASSGRRRAGTVGDVIRCEGTLYWRLVEPLLLAALNIDPPQGSARLAAAVIRETLAAGGRACRPLIARDGLGATLIEPALACLQQRDAAVRFEHQLRAIRFGTKRVDALDFGGETIALADDDAIILAVPPYAAASLVRGLTVPTEFRAIVNAHFRVAPPAAQPPILGVLNGTVEWLFAFPGRLSVTISAGDRLIDTPREELAKTIWAEVATVADLPNALPPWQIVRERRATFASTPEQDLKRPGAETAWRNLALAGDWTNTGLPATIEGAIRSGNRAAELLAHR